jgi:hypothetical protein
VADEGKQRDFDTGPDSRSKEEKLLVIIFSDQSTAIVNGQREAAISSLMKVTGLDREALVKRYTTKAGSGGDIAEKILKDHIAQGIKLKLEIAGLEMKIENLKARHEQELAHRIQMETLLMQGHQVEVRRLKAERDALEFELAIRKSPVFPEIKCAAPGCVNMFRPSRRDATTCSAACRKAMSRARRKQAIRSPDSREA